MKKVALLSIVIALSLSMLACAGAPQQAPVEVPIDDFMNQKHISQTVTVASGETFTVTLGSNPTTGFQWQEPMIATIAGEPTVVEQIGHQFIPPDEPVPGAPGKDVWTFRATGKGRAVISMEYSRPWEGGEKGEWTYTLTVTVK